MMQTLIGALIGIAATVAVGRYYYRQNPKLLRWALLNPIDRVQYGHLLAMKEQPEDMRQRLALR